MSDMSFVSAVKAESFLHSVFSLVTSEFAVFPEFVRDRVLGFISNNVRGSGDRRSRMVENGGFMRGLRMVGFIRILFVRVSDIDRTSRF
jgi:hypothetical protein